MLFNDGHNPRKNTIYVLRGLPGIGKSTWVKQNLLKEETISSDELRLLYPMATTYDGKEVITQRYDRIIWKLLYNMLEARMIAGVSPIIIDATHTKKSYIQAYEYYCNKYGYKLVVVEFPLDLKAAKKRNDSRDSMRYVPEVVIDRMYEVMKSNSAEVAAEYNVVTPEVAAEYVLDDRLIVKEPITYEKLEKIILTDSPWMSILVPLVPVVGSIIGYDQKNIYHDSTLDIHTEKVVNALYRHQRLTKESNFPLLLAGLFHDIGKPFVAVEDKNGTGEFHFPDHARVGAEMWKDYLASNFDLTIAEKERVYDLILHHDDEAKKGDKDLLYLQLCDALAHREKGNVIKRINVCKKFLGI